MPLCDGPFRTHHELQRTPPTPTDTQPEVPRKNLIISVIILFHVMRSIHLYAAIMYVYYLTVRRTSGAASRARQANCSPLCRRPLAHIRAAEPQGHEQEEQLQLVGELALVVPPH